VYQDDPSFSRLLDLLEQRPVVVGVGVQLPHRDLQALEGAAKDGQTSEREL